MKKRLIATLLTVAMCLALMPATALAEVGGTITKSSGTFSDMPNDWSTKALENAVANGLLTGTNGKIMAKENLSRAQMAAVLGRAFGATSLGDVSKFTDVAPTDWFYSDIQKAVSMKTFTGAANKMNPNASISRQEAFVVLARALKLSDANPNLSAFTDGASVADWAKAEVSALVKAGYISGSNGKINPLSNITRAEFATIMDKAVANYVKTAGTVTTVVKGNVMVNAPGVTLKNLTVDGDLIVGDGVGNGDITIDNVKVLGRTIVRGGGANSFKAIGGSKMQDLIIAKTADGGVRVYTADGTTVDMLYVDDGKDNIIIEGTFGTVQVASNTPVSFNNATVKTITATGKNADITVAQGSKVETVVTAQPNTTLNIAGTVTNVAATKEATGASVNVGKTGTAKNVTTAAPNTTVANDGKVGTLAVAKNATETKVVVGTNSKMDKVVNETKENLTVTTAAAEKAAADKAAAEKALAAAKTADEKAKAEAAKAAADKAAADAKAEAERVKTETNNKTEIKPVAPPVIGDTGKVEIPVTPEKPVTPPSIPDQGGDLGGDDVYYYDTAWVRPDGGATDADGTSNPVLGFKYAEEYAKLGSTVNKATSGNNNTVTVVVDAAKLAAQTGKVSSKVLKTIGEKNYYYVGVQFKTPTDAKGAKVIYGDAAEKTVNLTKDGAHAFDKKLVQYVGVAEVGADLITIDPDNTEAYNVKWFKDTECKTPCTSTVTSSYTIKLVVNNEVLEAGTPVTAQYGRIADLAKFTEATEVTLVKEATVEADLAVPANVTLAIPTGVTLTVANGVTLTNNATTITNKGGIFNFGTFTNAAGKTIENTGMIVNDKGNIITNKGTITNEAVDESEYAGEIYNFGALANIGTITNESTGKIANVKTEVGENNGIITNEGTITNAGTIANANDPSVEANDHSNPANDATIENFGTFTNTATGTINNAGTITNETVEGASASTVLIVNAGTITNTGMIVSDPGTTITNNSIITNEDATSNVYPGDIYNCGALENTKDGKITNAANCTIINAATGKIANNGTIENAGDIVNRNDAPLVESPATTTISNAATGIITNAGTIKNNAKCTINNAGKISGAGTLSGAGTIDNYGEIVASNITEVANIAELNKALADATQTVIFVTASIPEDINITTATNIQAKTSDLTLSGAVKITAPATGTVVLDGFKITKAVVVDAALGGEVILRNNDLTMANDEAYGTSKGHHFITRFITDANVAFNITMDNNTVGASDNIQTAPTRTIAFLMNDFDQSNFPALKSKFTFSNNKIFLSAQHTLYNVKAEIFDIDGNEFVSGLKNLGGTDVATAVTAYNGAANGTTTLTNNSFKGYEYGVKLTQYDAVVEMPNANTFAENTTNILNAFYAQTLKGLNAGLAATSTGIIRVIGTDNALEITGEVTVPADKTLEIRAGKTLTVATDATLTVNGTLVNNGTIVNDGTIDGTAIKALQDEMGAKVETAADAIEANALFDTAAAPYGDANVELTFTLTDAGKETAINAISNTGLIVAIGTFVEANPDFQAIGDDTGVVIVDLTEGQTAIKTAILTEMLEQFAITDQTAKLSTLVDEAPATFTLICETTESNVPYAITITLDFVVAEVPAPAPAA